MEVYIVAKNADFTEGRGPMRFHKVFSAFKKADDYIMSCKGLFGSEQYKDKVYNWNDYIEHTYNGYSIIVKEVE